MPPAALGTAGTQAKLPGSSLPIGRLTLSGSTYCAWQALRRVHSGMWSETESFSGSKALHCQPVESAPPFTAPPEFKFNPVRRPCSVASVVSALRGPMDRSLPGSSVHGILQARILQWVAMPSSRGSSRCRVRTHVSDVSRIHRQVLYH